MAKNATPWSKILSLGLIISIGFAITLSHVPLSWASEGEEKQVRSRIKDPYHDYPEVFSGRGVLDDISSQAIVISDSEYILDSNASFNIPNQINVSSSLFKQGQFVAYIQSIVLFQSINKPSDCDHPIRIV